MSSWDMYAKEVASGKLEWSPSHKSENFWRDNRANPNPNPNPNQVNVVGDFALVSCLGWGLRGAAIATTTAQCVATAALVRSASPSPQPQP